MPILKALKLEDIIYQKELVIVIDSYTVIINGKTFYDQAIDSDIKRYKQIRKLTTGQHEDYTAGRLLNYDYNKNHYKFLNIVPVLFFGVDFNLFNCGFVSLTLAS